MHTFHGKNVSLIIEEILFTLFIGDVEVKTLKLLMYAVINLLVLNVSVSPLFAQAPTTPKILFTSVREGNYEVYVMNADGSHQ